MSLEDEAFNALTAFICFNKNLELISAHPPSGKSYFTDLIRIPSPTQNKTGNRRAHIDIIFCSKQYLYLCEVKGTAKEANEDIIKLRSIRDYYQLDKLKNFIIERLTQPYSFLKCCSELVLAIGCTKVDSKLEQDILYIQAEDANSVTLKGNLSKSISLDFVLL